jgi:hypothetical protein
VLDPTPSTAVSLVGPLLPFRWCMKKLLLVMIVDLLLSILAVSEVLDAQFTTPPTRSIHR